MKIGLLNQWLRLFKKSDIKDLTLITFTIAKDFGHLLIIIAVLGIGVVIKSSPQKSQ